MEQMRDGLHNEQLFYVMEYTKAIAINDGNVVAVIISLQLWGHPGVCVLNFTTNCHIFAFEKLLVHWISYLIKSKFQKDFYHYVSDLIWFISHDKSLRVPHLAAVHLFNQLSLSKMLFLF